MNNFNEEERKIYIKTFFSTLGVVAIVVALCMFYSWCLIANDIKHPKVYKTVEELDYYLIDFLIEKNLYLLSKFPKNYGYNIRLGTLYGIKKDYYKSEQQFKIAVDKSPYMAYNARFKLANLYIKLNRLEEAQKLIDEVVDKADKKLIKGKGEIYKKIGDKLFEQDYFMIAATKYEKSVFYYKRYSKKKMQESQKLLSTTYEKIADMYVEKENFEDAIDYLEKANTLDEKSSVYYKLALLYVNTEPSISAKYLDYVLKNDPKMLDYYMYYDLLMQISEAEGELGNTAARDLFALKAKKFQQFAHESILYTDDILIDILDVKSSYIKKTEKLNLDVKFQLRNNSPFNIKTLNVEIRIKENNQIVEKIDKSLFAFENIFPMGEQTNAITMNCNVASELLNPKYEDVILQIYIYKKKKNKQLLKEIPVKKPIELTKTKKNSFFF